MLIFLAGIVCSLLGRLPASQPACLPACLHTYIHLIKGPVHADTLAKAVNLASSDSLPRFANAELRVLGA